MKQSSAGENRHQFDLATRTPYGTPMARGEVAMKYACPRCKAQPGQRCQGLQKVRKSNHIERWKVAAKDLGLLPR